MRKEAILEVNNNKIHIEASSEVLHTIREVFKYRHPGQFYMRKFMPRGWDGYMRHLSEAGYMPTGLLPKLIKYLDENKYEYEIDDLRVLPEFKSIPSSIAGVNARDYQDLGVRNVVTNYVGGIYFPRGIINAAPNAGKTHMMFAIHKSYKHSNTLILLQDSNLFTQFMQDMPKVFKEKEWGYIRGKEIRWGSITVAMAQTLVNHIGRFKKEMEKVNILLIDECDLSKNKTVQTITSHLYNASIRVGLSGTIFKRNLAKDRPKNEFLQAFFGEELLVIKNKELMERGISSPVVVKVSIGNRFLPSGSSYDVVYSTHIVKSVQRNTKILERVKFYLDRKKTPIIVACRLHEHVHILYEMAKKKWGLDYVVDYVHTDREGKAAVIEKFRKGDIDILIASKVINRGQNMPLIKTIINAAGGDGPEVVLQLLGRGSRTNSDKAKFYFEDFIDAGDYLERHSKHRLAYYKAEGFKVILLDDLGKTGRRRK